MPIPTQGLTEKMQLNTDKLNAQRAAIHNVQSEAVQAGDISAAQSAKLADLLADPKPLDPDSVAAKTGGAPDEPIRIIEHGGLRIKSEGDMITVLDLYNGTDKAFLHSGKPKEPERIVPPLSAKTLAEMEAGRKRLAEHSATYRPPPLVDKSVGQPVPLPGDYVKPFTSKLG